MKEHNMTFEPAFGVAYSGEAEKSIQRFQVVKVSLNEDAARYESKNMAGTADASELYVPVRIEQGGIVPLGEGYQGTVNF